MNRNCLNCPYFYECDNMGWYENEVCKKEEECKNEEKSKQRPRNIETGK